MDAIVLCGGKGTRLASVVSDVPKPLAPVSGRPFLDYVLAYLERSGLVGRVILATGHLAQKVEAHYGERFGRLALCHNPESVPLGTGGAVFQAARRHGLDGPFFILNGDSFVDADLAALARLQEESNAAVALTVFGVDDAARFGTVVLAGKRVSGFVEKTGRHEPGLINAGIYVASSSALGEWLHRDGFVSLEQEVLPALVERGSVSAMKSGERFIDIGLPETYASAATFFAAQ